MTPLLVIGYGNELRGDDGVGPAVARRVAEWMRPGVRALAVHQIVPELAAELASAERVVFVDAAAGEDEVRMRAVDRCDVGPVHGHAGTPGWLLAATRRLFGHAPEAWLITIPAGELGYGAGLSSAAEVGVQAALRRSRLSPVDRRSRGQTMCLGIPGRVVERLGDGDGLEFSLVEFAGLRRKVCTACVPDANPGDFVIVHAGLAISRLDGDEAERLLAHIREMVETDGWDTLPGREATGP
jgi:hydrogenase maturation protease